MVTLQSRYPDSDADNFQMPAAAEVTQEAQSVTPPPLIAAPPPTIAAPHLADDGVNARDSDALGPKSPVSVLGYLKPEAVNDVAADPLTGLKAS